MMSIEAMSGAGQGDYYIELAREDYYLEGGEPPGEWTGRGAEQLKLEGRVEKEEFRNLIQGYSPDGDKELVQNAGKENRQSGWDLTFSAPKSVSTVWSQAEPEIRQEIQAAHREAVGAALQYLEDNFAYARRGRGGHDREAAGLVAATFEHGTSRAQDPQLHTHAIVLNVGTREDGSNGTIESKPLYQSKMAAGALYRAELAKQLEDRLGFDIERERFSFAIKGVSEELNGEFSTRRKEIESALEEKGFTSSKAASVAALDTRQVKEHVARETLFERWQTTGQEHGWSTEQAKELLDKGPLNRDLKTEARAAVDRSLERITAHDNTFGERDLVRFTAEEAQGRGLGAGEVLSAVSEQLKNSPEIVFLGSASGEVRYTTREMLETEKEMMARVERLANSKSTRAAGSEVLESVFARRPTISDEQRKAVLHITSTPGQVKAVSGMAGTGKSYMLGAAREVWEQEGLKVFGAALSGKAAQGLEEGSGIQSETLHKRFQQIENGELTLSPSTVFVVDEAGMVGTRQMSRLIGKVEKSGAKLVLVGDARQLQPVDAGGPFKAISERVGYVELKNIQRQREKWARDAVHKIAHGEASEMLTDYAERGLLFVGKDRAAALDQAFQDWKSEGIKKPQEHLLLAGTNQDVRRLNDRAQAERYRAGELGEGSVRANSQTFFESDRVLLTRNSRVLGVKNGSLGTIERINSEERTFSAKLDNGEKVTIPLEDYEHVRLGYAVTTHKSQGCTVENSYVILGGAMQDRELSYVQASRARGTTRLYSDETEAGEQLRDLAKEMSRSRQKDLAINLEQEKAQQLQQSGLKRSQEIGM